MKRNIHSYPTKISWEHSLFVKKKHTKGLKTCKKNIKKSCKQFNNILEVWKIRIELRSAH